MFHEWVLIFCHVMVCCNLIKTYCSDIHLLTQRSFHNNYSSKHRNQWIKYTWFHLVKNSCKSLNTEYFRVVLHTEVHTCSAVPSNLRQKTMTSKPLKFSPTLSCRPARFFMWSLDCGNVVVL